MLIRKLLKISYLHSLVKSSNIKAVYLSVIYKVLTIFNYSSFFYLKLVSIKNIYYRFYLIHVNFYFLFIDYIYLVNYLKYLNKNKFSLFSLPIKIKSYSVCRSPFVYSKSREDFEVKYHKLFFNIKPWKLSETYVYFLDMLLSNLKFDNSKSWYKKAINL